MTSKTLFLALVQQWAQADRYRHFNFTSGHLNAVSLSDEDIAFTLGLNAPITNIKLVIKGCLEALKFIVILFLPIKNASIFIRTVLRKIFNKNTIYSNKLTILSLGNHGYIDDPYFSPLLKAVGCKFNYLKIVGSSVFKSKQYTFVESSLTLIQIFLLMMFVPFFSIVAMCYLFQSSLGVEKFRYRIIYIYLGLKEINLGVTFNSYVISEAIKSVVEKVSDAKFIYPMEGRNWEKKINNRMTAISVYSVGYIHCALTPRHLSLLDHNFTRADEWPSLVITPSVMAYTKISKNPLSKNVVKGFFLRGDESHTQKTVHHSKHLEFVLTANIAESMQIMKFAAALQKEKGYESIIRLNPNSSTYKKLADYAVSQGLELFNKDSNSLPKVCFYRSSSVALDYLKHGVPPIYIEVNDIISYNTFELDNKFGFSSIKLDDDFNDNVDAIIKKSSRLSVADGSKASKYYLDQSYHADDLKNLID